MAQAISSDKNTQPKPHGHNRWLLLIALYKGTQALLIAAIGVGALHLLHKDAADELATLADRLHFNPEGHLIDFLLDKASLLDDPLLRRIGLAAFSYSGLSLAEGIGLYLEQAWGEYLTLVITASFLPLELIEIFRRLTLIRTSLLAINVVVLLYLFRLLMCRTRQRAEQAELE